MRRRQALTALPFRTGVVRFESGTVTTTRDPAPALASIAAELRRDTGLRVTARLVADGIARDRLSPLGCGDARPLWYDDMPSRRAANRRAEFVRTLADIRCTPAASFE